MSRVCLMPAILASFTVDNSSGTEPMTGVFALKFNEPGVWQLNDQHGWRGKQRVGFGLRRELGFQAMIENEPGDRGATMQAFLRDNVLDGLDQQCAVHHLGDCGGVWFEVPPGGRRTLLIAMGAYIDGTVTTRSKVNIITRSIFLICWTCSITHCAASTRSRRIGRAGSRAARYQVVRRSAVSDRPFNAKLLRQYAVARRRRQAILGGE